MSDPYGQFAAQYAPPPEEVAPPPPAPATAPPPAPAPAGDPYGQFAAQYDPAATPPQAAPPSPEPTRSLSVNQNDVMGPRPQGQAMQQASPAPAASQTPPKQYPFSPQGIAQQAADDLGAAVQEFREQPNLLAKGGQLLGAFQVLPDKAKERAGQRAIDAATKGDPDATLGGMSPRELLKHPENIIDSVARDVLNPTGQGAIPALNPAQPVDDSYNFTQWAEENPDAVARAQESGDPRVLVDDYFAAQGQTLETGGLRGALEGIARETLMDPTLPLSLGSSIATRGVGLGAAKAGMTGAVRGTQIADNLIQTAIDPAGELAVRGLTRGIKALRPSPRTVQTTATENVREAVGSALGTRSTAMGPTPEGTVSAAPPAPVAPTGDGGVPPVAPLAPPAPVVPTPSGAGAGATTPAPAPVNPSPGIPPIVPPPVNPYTTGPLSSLPALMRDGRRNRWVRADGGEVDVPTMTRAAQAIVDVPPAEMKPFVFGRAVSPEPDSLPSQYLAVMTQNGRAYDDWPTARTRGGDRETPSGITKRQAGDNWLRLSEQRIRKHGAAEVERLVADFQHTQAFDAANPGAVPPNRQAPGYWANRAEAIREAAVRAEFPAAFQLHHNGGSVSYAGRGDNPARLNSEATSPPPVPIAQQGLEYERAFKSAYADTLSHFANPSAQRSVQSRLDALLADPDGFAPNSPHKAFREQMYRSGAWRKPNARSDVTRDPAAYARYVALRDYHHALHPDAPTSQTLFRRATLYHGSPVDDLTTLSANPPWSGRTNPNAGSTFGLFTTPDRREAGLYAGPTGRVYEADVDLQNPFYMTTDDFYRRFVDQTDGNTNPFTGEHFPGSPESYERAESFKRALTAMGHDGIILHYDGNKDDVLEVISFSDANARHLSDGARFRRAAPGGDLTLHGSLTAQELAVAAEFGSGARAHLDRMGLQGVDLAFVDAVRAANDPLRQLDDLAQYDPEIGAIDISLRAAFREVLGEASRGGALLDGPALDAAVRRGLYQTLNHEAVHALRAKGVITDEEWQLLVAEARQGGQRQWAEQTYPDLAARPDALDEEAVAEMFGDFALGRKALSEPTRSIFQKIVDVFTGLVKVLRGVPDAERVMGKLLSGEVGGRTPGYRGTVYHGSMRDDLTTISADPPFRQFGNAGSTFGVFTTPSRPLAGNYARTPFGREGRVYQAAIELNNPYYMDHDEFYADFVHERDGGNWGDDFDEFGGDDPFAEAAELKTQLIRDGHDGIILYRDGDRANVSEVVSFSDLPMQHLPGGARFRRSRAPAADPTDPQLAPGDPDDPRWALLADGQKPFMRYPIDYNGTRTRLWDVMLDVEQDVLQLRADAVSHAKTPLTGKALTEHLARLKRYDAYEPRYDWADPRFSDFELDRIANDRVVDLYRKSEFPDADTPAAKSALTTLKQINADVMATRRRVGLSGLLQFPRQIVTQTFGNVVAPLIAGRPDVAMRMLDPLRAAQIFKQLRGNKDSLTNYQVMLRNMGIPQNAQIHNPMKALAKNQTVIKNGGLRKFADIIAPEWAGDLVSLSDNVSRDLTSYRTFVPAMKREQARLPKKAAETAQAWRGGAGSAKKGLYVDLGRVESVVKTTLKNHKRRGVPLSEIDGGRLEKALYDEFSTQKGIDLGELRNFANRVGRDYNTVRNTHYQASAREVERIFFPWDNLNIDEMVSNFFLYHYWTTRAAKLYATEMAKKPWMAGAFLRLSQQIMEEAEQNDYPDWLKGYTRVLNSPLGTTLWMSPTDAIGNILMFQDWQYGAESGELKGDLTQLGALRGLLPLAFNPLLDYGAWLTGLYGGEDARLPPNPTGAEPTFARAAQILNAFGAAGLLPPGMLTDEFGNFRPVSDKIISEKLQQFGEAYFGRPKLDLYAGAKVNTQFYLEEVLLEEHDEWRTDPNGENELTRRANEIMLAVEQGQEPPEEYLEAERREAVRAITGPDFPGLPEPLRAIFGGVVRTVAPIRQTAQSTTKMQRVYGVGPAGSEPGSLPALGTTDDYDLKDAKNRPYDTLDMALLNARNEDWYDIGKDTGIAEHAGVYSAMVKEVPTVKANVTIGGFTYTPSQLALMPRSERFDIAEKYLNSKGFTVADKDAYYAARDEMLAAHPDLAGFQEYEQYIEQYPGGLPGFVDAAMRTSPSFARYMQQNALGPPGSEDFYKSATYPDAYFALEGRRGSVYDPLTLPEAGTIPGLAYGETFAMRRALNEVAEAAARAEGGGNDYTEFVGDIEEKVSHLYYAKQLLDQTYPGTGLVPGRDRLPYDMYQAMKGVWEANGVNPPEKGSIELEYYGWLAANATAPDHSVKAFLDQRESNSVGAEGGDMPPPTTGQIGEQLGIALVEASPARLNAQGMPDTAGMQRSTPAYAVEMRTGPSVNNPINVDAVFPDMALYVADRSPDGQWALVVAPGGLTGWVPTAALLKAA